MFFATYLGLKSFNAYLCLFLTTERTFLNRFTPFKVDLPNLRFNFLGVWSTTEANLSQQALSSEVIWGQGVLVRPCWKKSDFSVRLHSCTVRSISSYFVPREQNKFLGGYTLAVFQSVFVVVFNTIP